MIATMRDVIVNSGSSEDLADNIRLTVKIMLPIGYQVFYLRGSTIEGLP